MRIRGVVTVVFERGFCFVMAPDRKDYFLHFSDIRDGLRPMIKDVVEFELSNSFRPGKRPQAANAQIVSPLTGAGEKVEANPEAVQS